MLVRPCDNCPFRTDKPFHLSAYRAEEIVQSLLDGAVFQCHKTVHYDRFGEGDDEQYYNPKGDEKFCAGAMIVLMNSVGPNLMMELWEQVGQIDLSKLCLDSPVYSSLDEFVAAMYRRERGHV